jgi:S1-C subfamily serine protease
MEQLKKSALKITTVLLVLIMTGCAAHKVRSQYESGGQQKAYAIGSDGAAGAAWNQPTLERSLENALYSCESSTKNKGSCEITHANGVPYNEVILMPDGSRVGLEQAKRIKEEAFNNGRITFPDYKTKHSLTLHIDDPDYIRYQYKGRALINRFHAWYDPLSWEQQINAVTKSHIFSKTVVKHENIIDSNYKSEGRVGGDRTDFSLYFSHDKNSWALRKNDSGEIIMAPTHPTLGYTSVPDSLTYWLENIAVAHQRLTKIDANKNRVERKKLPENKQKETTPKAAKVIRDDEVFSAASGTGFIVTDKGHIITNNHVVKGCDNVKAHQNGKDYPATVIATDSVNDLALLKTTLTTKDVFSLSSKNAFLMQDIFVAGYPFGKLISSSVKITKGIVSALTGIGNNYSNMQIDAAIQPGNSGGPIINEKGNVIGVAVAKLSLAKAVKDWGVVPEGTNFGIKSSVVRNFMESNNINPMRPRTSSITKQQLAQKVTNSTLYLSCWMTYAKIKQMKSEKVMFTNFE